LYSIAGQHSYLIATAGNFVDKKKIPLSEINTIIMHIWFHDRPALHYTLEKAFWRIEEHLDKISYLGVDQARDSPVTIHVRFSGKPVDLQPFTITDRAGVTRQVVFSTHIPAGTRSDALHGSLDTLLPQHARKKKQQTSGDGNGTQ